MKNFLLFLQEINLSIQKLQKNPFDYLLDIITIILLLVTSIFSYFLARDSKRVREDAQTPIIKCKSLEMMWENPYEKILNFKIELINVGFDHFNLDELIINQKKLNKNDYTFFQYGGFPGRASYHCVIKNIFNFSEILSCGDNTISISYNDIGNRKILSQIRFNIEESDIGNPTKTISRELPFTNIKISKT